MYGDAEIGCRNRMQHADRMGGSAEKAGRPRPLSVGIAVGSYRRTCEPAVSVVAIAQLRPMVRRGMRLLGLDVGSKTIGLAVSDVTWSVATPVRTLQRGRLARDLEILRALVAELEAGGVVVGLPVEMDGREGPRCQSVRQFARDLERILRLPTAFWDERLSTAAVERFLIGEADLSRRRRRGVVDRAAAAWILQGALDALRHCRGALDRGEDSP
jgi:putative Holliday junction resolvase